MLLFSKVMKIYFIQRYKIFIQIIVNPHFISTYKIVNISYLLLIQLILKTCETF